MSVYIIQSEKVDVGEKMVVGKAEYRVKKSIFGNSMVGKIYRETEVESPCWNIKLESRKE